jgi:hypothetical protein
VVEDSLEQLFDRARKGINKLTEEELFMIVYSTEAPDILKKIAENELEERINDAQREIAELKVKNTRVLRWKPKPLQKGVSDEELENDIDLMYENVPLSSRKNPKKSSKKRGSYEPSLLKKERNTKKRGDSE